MQRRPNILVTGTPGVGKSTFSSQLAEQLDYEHINISNIIKDELLYSEYDEEYKCSIFDEAKVYDRIEEIIAAGGKIIDFHSCDFMHPSWFNIIFVLRAETHILYDRLAARLYTQNKIQENIQSEIFQVLLDEAIQTFGDDKIIQINNNNMDDLTANVAKAVQQIEALQLP